jgi:hypothetical protein
MVALIFALSFTQVVNAQSANGTGTTTSSGYTSVSPNLKPPLLLPLTEQQKADEEKAVAFLTNVAGVDVSKYGVKLGVDSHEPYDPNLPPPLIEETVHCNLSNAETILNAMCFFRGDSLAWCSLYAIKGSAVFTQAKATNDAVAAQNFLDRLQDFSATTYLPTMSSMLDSVSKIENGSILTAAETQMKISVEGSATTFVWSSSINNIENNQKVLVVTFRDGQFEFFTDNYDIYKIGTTEVKISKEEAIAIARERAHTYAWTVGTETVSNVVFADVPVYATLSMQSRGNYTLYPLWYVLLPLDKVYPGLVTSIQVSVWADTGEISYITASGAGGPPSQQSSTSANSSAVDSTYVIVAAVALVAAATLLGYLFYKRKR